MFSAYFARLHRNCNFVGGLNLVLGDHMSQCLISGVANPLGKLFIDRYLLENSPCLLIRSYLLIEKDSISTLCLNGTSSEVAKMKRDPKICWKTICKIEAMKASKTKKKSELQAIGLVSVSVFWSLRVFRQHFFMRFPQCRLHFVLLGLFKTLFRYLGMLNYISLLSSFEGIKNGWSFCRTVNTFLTDSGLVSSTKYFYYKAKSSTQLHSFSRISLIRFNGSEALYVLITALMRTHFLENLSPFSRSTILFLCWQKKTEPYLRLSFVSLH